MNTPPDQPQDLTPAMLEMQAQMAQLQAELASLKQKAQTLPHFAAAFPSPKPAITSSRRKSLKRLGLALLGGVTAATLTTFSVSEAKVMVSPTLGSGTTTSVAGAIVIPPGAATPIINPPYNGRYYGLIASGSSSALDLSTLPVGDIGVYAFSSGTGVYGSAPNGTGVIGVSNYGDGVHGYTPIGLGVYGHSDTGTGVYGGTNVGYAGYFYGDVHSTGALTASSKSFKIDHPLDPANKYLYHTSVESPDMKNIYDGNVTLDQQGEATVNMPDWFEALNSDFRYQLTSVGTASPDLHVSQEIKNRQFKIAGGKAGQRVSWQVTGIRQDAYAKAHRSPVEVEKTGDEKGKYIHPELFGQPEEKSVSPRPPQRLRK